MWLLLLCVIACRVHAIPFQDELQRRADASTSCPLLNLDSLGQVNKTSDQGDGNIGTSDFTQWGIPLSQNSSPIEVARRADDEPADAASARWKASLAKGRKLWSQLLLNLAYPGADFQMCDMKDRWDIDCDKDPEVLESLDPKWQVILPTDLGVPGLSSPEKTFYKTDVYAPKSYNRAFAFWYYGNSYSPKEGTIIVNNVRGTRLRGVPTRAPDRWSDVTYELWKTLCKHENLPTNNLRYILQNDVLNSDTTTLINDLIAKLGIHLAGEDSFTRSFTPSTNPSNTADEAFFVFLQSPNIIGTLYLLMTYVQGLGRKTIKSIGIWKGPKLVDADSLFVKLWKEEGCYMWVELEDYQALPNPAGVNSIW